MTEFLKNLNSLYWWISVVIVGVLINLFSAYLKSTFDNRLSKLSSWWRQRSEAQKAQRQVELEKLRNDKHKQIMAALDEARTRFHAILYLILGIFSVLAGSTFTVLFMITYGTVNPSGFPIIGKTILFALGSLSILIELRYWTSASYKHDLLTDALDDNSEGEA